MTDDRILRFLFVGDMMFNREYLLPPNADRDPAYYFSEVIDHFREADIVIGNLESVLYSEGVPLRPETGFQLYSPPEKMLPILKYLKFDVLSLGNNHIYDYGGQSPIKTKRLLFEEGFKAFGVGENQADSRTQLIVSKNNLRIGFLGYTTCWERRSLIT